MPPARWRTTDGGLPIDASGTFIDGTRFNGPAELRAGTAEVPRRVLRQRDAAAAGVRAQSQGQGRARLRLRDARSAEDCPRRLGKRLSLVVHPCGNHRERAVSDEDRRPLDRPTDRHCAERCTPRFQIATMFRVSRICFDGSPSTRSRSARSPVLIRPRSFMRNARAMADVAAASAAVGVRPALTRCSNSRCSDAP